MKDICSHLTLKKVDKGQMLFKYGDVGTKFYTILEGVATTIVPFGTNKQKMIYLSKEFRDITQD